MKLPRMIIPRARLVDADLVEVRPPTPLNYDIPYFDFQYERNLPLERSNKINRIIERIKIKQNENKNC